jgi:glycosyltransferase involved in cell wall biosynthesis
VTGYDYRQRQDAEIEVEMNVTRFLLAPRLRTRDKSEVMRDQVSVVIPTYNGAQFIASSLESVFAQTEPPAEIIVVDDCSTDETPGIVRTMAGETEIPLRLITLKENSGGPSRPHNTGIAAAQTKFIALLDQDDLMRPGKLAAQRRALLESPHCSLVIGRFSIIGSEDEDELGQMWPVPQFDGLADAIDEQSAYSVIESETAFKPLLSRNYAGSTSNFCFSTQWFEKIGEFDESITTCADLDFILRATIAGPLAIVNEKVFDYRWSGSSLQRQDLTRSLLEATMVRLRAASEKPEWAGDHLAALRHSALLLANAAVKKGDFRALRALAETFSKHKGMLALRQSLDEKVRRLVGLSDN